MKHMAMIKIPDGKEVRIFKENQLGQFSRYVLRNKKKLIFALEKIVVPENLTAKGLIEFAEQAKLNFSDQIITKRNL
jgi:hypothetical protein